MHYLSLFSGIGGFELGIGNRANCVGFSEIDCHAEKIYRRHFPEHRNFGDITTIDPADLPHLDLIVGGFPCQPFSSAGKQLGFADARGTLFFDIARITRKRQPRLLLLENVKGLLSHDHGHTFAAILTTLDELGYDCQWQVLNSKDYGVPQNRERLFIVGCLRGTPRPEVFPLAGGNKKAGLRIKTIAHMRRYRCSYQTVDETGISPTLVTERQPCVIVPEATKEGYAKACVGQSINLAVPNSQTRRGRVSDIAHTLDTGMQQNTLTENAPVRRLTPTECERLQGFPDGWTKGASDTQRYKMLGNAVTVNVVRAIASRIA